MRIIKGIKQLKEVMELQEENEALYNEKQYLEVELEETKKAYDITNKRCQQYYKLYNDIRALLQQNPNGSVTNLANTIKTMLEEANI